MPSALPLLIFDLDGVRFGLDATRVRETVWLPELAPVEEAPLYIAGMFSLRERFVPVTDLNLCFGHPARPYRTSDQVVVLEQDGLLMGLIVSEICDVLEFAPEAIRTPPTTDAETQKNAHFLAGEVRAGDDIVTLLDVGQLLRLPQKMAPPEMQYPARRFCPEATEEQHAVFRVRAKALLANIDNGENSRLALAVMELGGEYFGIGLETVQEFCDIAHPSQIPCCPPHILGAMSLRGTLLTLLDLRAALNLPHASPCGSKAVVARTSASLGTDSSGQMIGVAVDEVHDVVYLRQNELQPAPALLIEQRGAEIRGVASYAGKMMMVLDLPALLAREEWIVDESV